MTNKEEKLKTALTTLHDAVALLDNVAAYNKNIDDYEDYKKKNKMTNAEQIIRLLKIYSDGDSKKFYTNAEALAAKVAIKGNNKFSQELMRLIFDERLRDIRPLDRELHSSQLTGIMHSSQLTGIMPQVGRPPALSMVIRGV